MADHTINLQSHLASPRGGEQTADTAAGNAHVRGTPSGSGVRKNIFRQAWVANRIDGATHHVIRGAAKGEGSTLGGGRSQL